MKQIRYPLEDKILVKNPEQHEIDPKTFEVR